MPTSTEVNKSKIVRKVPEWASLDTFNSVDKLYLELGEYARHELSSSDDAITPETVVDTILRFGMKKFEERRAVVANAPLYSRCPLQGCGKSISHQRAQKGFVLCDNHVARFLDLTTTDSVIFNECKRKAAHFEGSQQVSRNKRPKAGTKREDTAGMQLLVDAMQTHEPFPSDYMDALWDSMTNDL